MALKGILMMPIKLKINGLFNIALGSIALKGALNHICVLMSEFGDFIFFILRCSLHLVAALSPPSSPASVSDFFCPLRYHKL